MFYIGFVESSPRALVFGCIFVAATLRLRECSLRSIRLVGSHGAFLSLEPSTKGSYGFGEGSLAFRSGAHG